MKNRSFPTAVPPGSGSCILGSLYMSVNRRETLVIRSLPLDVAVYAVFRMADRWLGKEFDVLDFGEYALLWRLVAQRLGRKVTVLPRQKRLPLIGPWDLPPSIKYRKA